MRRNIEHHHPLQGRELSMKYIIHEKQKDRQIENYAVQTTQQLSEN